MYQPISFNVIRQALEWHGIPVPAIRQLSFFDYDPEQVTAEYLASWTLDEVIDYMQDIPVPPYNTMFTRFIEALEQAFCEDVTVFYAYSGPVKEVFQATLYVKLSREIIAASNGDWLS